MKCSILITIERYLPRHDLNIIDLDVKHQNKDDNLSKDLPVCAYVMFNYKTTFCQDVSFVEAILRMGARTQLHDCHIIQTRNILVTSLAFYECLPLYAGQARFHFRGVLFNFSFSLKF